MTAVREGTLSGMNECDRNVSEELRGRFAEMQPVLKKNSLTRDDLGSCIRWFAEDNDILSRSLRITRKDLPWQLDSARYAAPHFASRPRGQARLPVHQERSEPVLPSFWCIRVRGPV